jgi:hypothetical protein
MYHHVYAQVSDLYRLAVHPDLDAIKVWQAHLLATRAAGAARKAASAATAHRDAANSQRFAAGDGGDDGADAGAMHDPDGFGDAEGLDDGGYGYGAGGGDDDDDGYDVGDGTGAAGLGSGAAPGGSSIMLGPGDAGYDPLSIDLLLPAARKVAKLEVNYDKTAKQVRGVQSMYAAVQHLINVLYYCLSNLN